MKENLQGCLSCAIKPLFETFYGVSKSAAACQGSPALGCTIQVQQKKIEKEVTQIKKTPIMVFADNQKGAKI